MISLPGIIMAIIVLWILKNLVKGINAGLQDTEIHINYQEHRIKTKTTSTEIDEAIQGLTSLGFSKKQAQDMAKTASGTTAEQIMKAALKSLAA